jgi:hypothetical protein
MSIKLYHYTTSEGAKGIESSKIIYRSTDGGPDATYGAGVYLTDLDWETDPETIAQYIYDGDGFWERKMDNVSNVVEIQLKKDKVKEVDSSRHIWLYPEEDLDLNKSCVIKWRVIKNIPLVKKIKEILKAIKARIN